MATNPFGAGARQWRRVTEALRATSTVVLGKGELVVSDAGKAYVPDGTKQLKDLSPLVDAAAVAATYQALALQADGITYNSDGSVATSTLGGITTTYTYDSNGNVATEARLGKTKTWSYDGSGNPTGSVIA